jgi:hypothetical protein
MQSRIVLLADPSNSDARIVALLAAFGLEDGRAYRASLRDRWPVHQLPSERSGVLLAELLEARAGQPAAQAFLDALDRALEQKRAARTSPSDPEAPLPHELWQRLNRDTSSPDVAEPAVEPRTGDDAPTVPR